MYRPKTARKCQGKQRPGAMKSTAGERWVQAGLFLPQADGGWAPPSRANFFSSRARGRGGGGPKEGGVPWTKAPWGDLSRSITGPAGSVFGIKSNGLIAIGNGSVVVGFSQISEAPVDKGESVFGISRDDARASRTLVRFTISVSVPSGRLMRHIPGHLASGTMRGSRTGFLGDPRPVFSPLQGIETSTEFSACPTLDKG